jgi:Mg2+ and Co2+ transporter CorA
MFKKLRGLKNEIENKLIKKDHDMDRDLESLMQSRKRVISIIQ